VGLVVTCDGVILFFVELINRKAVECREPAVGIGHGFRQGVRQQEAQAAAKTLLKLGLESLVVVNAGKVKVVGHPEKLRKRSNGLSEPLIWPNVVQEIGVRAEETAGILAETKILQGLLRSDRGNAWCRIRGRSPCLGEDATETQKLGIDLVRIIQPGHQMRAMVAYVSNADQHVSGQLALHFQAPRLHHRVMRRGREELEKPNAN